MKSLLTILGSIGFASSAGAPVALSYVNSETIQKQEQEVIQGTIATNLIAQKDVEDWTPGRVEQHTDENSKTILWAEMGITPDMYNRIDFKNSSITLAIKHGYGDNSGDGNYGGWDTNEKFNEIDRFWSSGKLLYEEDRHHGGDGRNTDHLWQYSLKTEAQGIIIWDYVWVWANGNWGNVARSEADINIKSVHYDFKLL